MEGGHEKKKHLALWGAVAGTMVVVMALWAMVLPTQMQELELAREQNRDRWQVAEESESAVIKSFAEVLGEQREALKEIEARMGRAESQPEGAAAKLDELKGKFEAASHSKTEESTDQDISEEPQS